jgi:ABC-type lipoprotein export system ATPase subunit
MKKIYIEKFKSIYNELCIDLEANSTIALLGQNGIGKTNILLAIDWFFNSTKNEDIRTVRKSMSGLTEPAKVTLIEEITIDQIKKVKEIISKNDNSWKMDQSKLDFKNLYNIIQKVDTFINKKYHENFTTINNEVYNSVYLYLVNFYISIGIEYLNSIGENIEGLFLKNGDNLYYSINESLYSEYELKKGSESKTPISQKKFLIMQNCKKVFEKFKNVFRVDDRYGVVLIKNADLENKSNVVYSLTELTHEGVKNDDVALIVDFLNNYFPFENKIKTLSDYQQNAEKAAETGIFTSDLIDEINVNTKEGIRKLFSSFDIYAIPNFNFSGNQLVLTVEDKNNIDILERKTEFNSSGYKAFFQFVLKLKAIENRSQINKEKTFLLLADEPDKNLHILLQHQLLNFFINIANQNNNVKILYTTHSPYLINPLENTIYVIDKYIVDKGQNISGSTYISKFNKELRDLSGNKIISLLPIFKSIDYIYGDNDLSITSFFNNLMKDNKFIYIDKKVDIEQENIEPFLEVAERSGFKVDRSVDITMIEKLDYGDIIFVKEDEIEKDYQYFDKLLSKSEDRNVKVIVIKKTNKNTINREK